MREGPDIAHLASMIGDPARANMLTALMSGKALTATELATEAGVTAQTASAHLAKLSESGLILSRKQGRHKYFALNGADVAAVLEGLMGLAAGKGHLRTRTGPRDPELREARLCYNHLAGIRGVQLYDSLVHRGFILPAGPCPTLTGPGERFVKEFGVEVEGLMSARAPLCRECLDWSARRPHLAGSLGRALWSRIVALGWATTEENARVVRFSSSGVEAFDAAFPMFQRGDQSRSA